MGPGDYHAMEAAASSRCASAWWKRFATCASSPTTRAWAHRRSVRRRHRRQQRGRRQWPDRGAIAGTVIGSILGFNIEKQANERPGVEVTVLLDSGKYIAVCRKRPGGLPAGDRVRVLGGPQLHPGHALTRAPAARPRPALDAMGLHLLAGAAILKAVFRARPRRAAASSWLVVVEAAAHRGRAPGGRGRAAGEHRAA
jgi:hypothetical protein